MERRKAWDGFYKALSECKAYEKQALRDGHDCNVRTKWRMAEMRARKYCKALVLEYGLQDVHTKKYMEI